jgi:uncharacterized membrane-anchored protein YitT (DUF2179 family)
MITSISKRAKQESVLHPTCTVSRTTVDNMVLILLSVTVAGIVTTISIKRNRTSSSRLIRSGIVKEEFSISRENAGQSVTLSPIKPFLIVVLPDGTIVTQG